MRVNSDPADRGHLAGMVAVAEDDGPWKSSWKSFRSLADRRYFGTRELPNIFEGRLPC